MRPSSHPIPPQVLDDGRLTDSKGRVIDFSNTIVLATTNLGAAFLLKDVEAQGACTQAATTIRADVGQRPALAPSPHAASSERKRVRLAAGGDASFGGATTSVSESDVDMSAGGGLQGGTRVSPADCGVQRGAHPLASLPISATSCAAGASTLSPETEARVMGAIRAHFLPEFL